MDYKNIEYNPGEYVLIISKDIVFCVKKDEINKHKYPIDEIREIKFPYDTEVWSKLIEIENLFKILLQRSDTKNNYSENKLMSKAGGHISDLVIQDLSLINFIKKEIDEIEKIFDSNFHLIGHLGYDTYSFKANYSEYLHVPLISQDKSKKMLDEALDNYFYKK